MQMSISSKIIAYINTFIHSHARFHSFYVLLFAFIALMYWFIGHPAASSGLLIHTEVPTLILVCFDLNVLMLLVCHKTHCNEKSYHPEVTYYGRICSKRKLMLKLVPGVVRKKLYCVSQTKSPNMDNCMPQTCIHCPQTPSITNIYTYINCTL